MPAHLPISTPPSPTLLPTLPKPPCLFTRTPLQAWNPPPPPHPQPYPPQPSLFTLPPPLPHLGGDLEQFFDINAGGSSAHLAYVC